MHQDITGNNILQHTLVKYFRYKIMSSSHIFCAENLLGEAAHVEYGYFILLTDLLPDKHVFRDEFSVIKDHIDQTKVKIAAGRYVLINDELGEVVKELFTLCSL